MTNVDGGCKSAAGDESFVKKVAEWRGWDEEFVWWCLRQGYLDALSSGVAFPVRDSSGIKVGAHVRAFGDQGAWRYEPSGLSVAPTVYGSPGPMKFVFIFESSWDALATMFVLGLHEVPAAILDCYCLVVTRGSQLGRRVAEVLPAGCYSLCAVMQRDTPRPGKSQTPADKWLADVESALGVRPGTCYPPAGLKDINDWARTRSAHPEIRGALTKSPKLCEITGHSGPASTAAARQETAAVQPVLPDPFPLHLLPDVLRAYVEEVARLEQVDHALPALAVLGVVSAALGRRPVARLVAAHKTHANLYVVAVVPSGVGKSAVLNRVATALRRIEQKRLEVWQRETKPQLLAELRALERLRTSEERRQATTGAEAAESIISQTKFKKWAITEARLKALLAVEPRLLAEDVTPEKIAMLLAGELECLTLLSAEPGDALAVLRGRYHKREQAGTDTLLLKAFSLDSHTADRVNRDSVQLRAPCLSLLWAMQPFLLKQLLDGGSSVRSGLLARMLVAQIDAVPATRLEHPQENQAVLERFDELVQKLAEGFRLKPGEVEIPCHADAREVMEDFRIKRNNQAMAAVGDFGALLARHTEQACRIAVVLHCAQHEERADQMPIDRDAALKAIELADWFAQEQALLISNEATSVAAEEEEQTRAWFAVHPRNADGTGFTAREVRRLAKVRFAPDLADRLVSEGFLARQTVATAGRQREEFVLVSGGGTSA